MNRAVGAVLTFVAGAAVVVLAVANRAPVTVTLDPFRADPALALRMPLFVLVFAALAVGVLGGAIAGWPARARSRRAARAMRREIERLRREVNQAGAAALPAPHQNRAGR